LTNVYPNNKNKKNKNNKVKSKPLELRSRVKKHNKKIKDGEGGLVGRLAGWRAGGRDGVWDVWDVVKKCLTFSKWECLGYSN
jgi:hypothetical protein